MKKQYVNNLQNDLDDGEEVSLLCWLVGRRHHGKIIFLDVCDSTGSIQAVVKRSDVNNGLFDVVRKVPLESSIQVEGVLVFNDNRGNRTREIMVRGVTIVGEASKKLSPGSRSAFDIFDATLVDHLLSHRHLYIRNKKVMAILRFRHILLGIIHRWFRENGFIEITAPILTKLPLYDDGTAIPVHLHGENAFLTQCVGFYLESAVHAFEKVYNIGPSFRGEESRSRRHLMEYWHVKAEVAFSDLDDIIRIVESLIHYAAQCSMSEAEDVFEVLGERFSLDGLATPFPRLTYKDAVSMLRASGSDIEFGTSLGSTEEELLSAKFETPFWVTGIPRTVEPFPYVIDQDNPEVTRTADLIASRGFGELLGVAEKITDLAMLDERLKEKGKLGDPRYGWVRDLREYGCVPHVGFGMGLERLIRWFLNIPHVRDTTPFPRIFRRRIYP